MPEQNMILSSFVILNHAPLLGRDSMHNRIPRPAWKDEHDEK